MAAPLPWVIRWVRAVLDMSTLVHGLRRRDSRRGLQTMCIGHGMATATIIEAA